MKPTVKYGLLIGALVMAGCVDTAKRDAIKQIALNQIMAFNAQGIDPIQLDPTRLFYLNSLCVTATSLSTVINPDAPEATDTIIDACEVIAKAAAKAGTEDG